LSEYEVSRIIVDREGDYPLTIVLFLFRHTQNPQVLAPDDDHLTTDCKVPKTGTYEAMGDEMERNRIR
jgi:hypothetical protein